MVTINIDVFVCFQSIISVDREEQKKSAERVLVLKELEEREFLKILFSLSSLSHILPPVTHCLQWCDMSQQNTLNNFEHFLPVSFDKRVFFSKQTLQASFHFYGNLPGTKSISRRCNEKCYLMQAVENILTIGGKIQLFMFYMVFLYSLVGAKKTEALQSLRFFGRSYI